MRERALKPIEPVDVAHLFPELHAELMAVLRGLRPEDWNRPTSARLWSVRDVAAHLLDGDLRRLTYQRDGLTPRWAPADGQDLLGFLNELNAVWVKAADRIGPRLLVEFHAVTGPQLAASFASLDPHAPAFYPVAWAGEARSENWFDVAREYTEKWHHQQQIREAVGIPGLTAKHLLAPVLAISVRALPHTYRDVAAADGASVVLEIGGDSGGAWSLVREPGAWRLFAGAADAPTSRVVLDQDPAWRLFFKALGDPAAHARVDGDAELARPLLGARAVMA